LAPATIEELLGVIEADASARPPLPGGLNSKAHTLDRLARELSVREGEPKPILMGRHLIQVGLEPGPHFGPILNKAFEAQLDGQFNDLPGAIAWAQQEVL
jgi:tRNA nucleotidyltransferase (CCA-adding enzyme)